MRNLLKLSLLVAVVALSHGSPGAAPARPNVLFIAIDDLNHWVGYLHRNDQPSTRSCCFGWMG